MHPNSSRARAPAPVLIILKKYLEETSGVLEDIRTLEEKHRKPSVIQRAKEAAMEAKTAAKELFSNEAMPGAEEIEGDDADDRALVEEEINDLLCEEESNYQSRDSGGQREGEKSSEHPALAGLSGRATLPIETAAAIIGAQTRSQSGGVAINSGQGEDLALPVSRRSSYEKVITACIKHRTSRWKRDSEREKT
jgi:hypothetical protein